MATQEDLEIYKKHLASMQELDPDIVAIPEAFEENNDWLQKIRKQSEEAEANA